jgi:hypothetical protein
VRRCEIFVDQDAGRGLPKSPEEHGRGDQHRSEQRFAFDEHRCLRCFLREPEGALEMSAIVRESNDRRTDSSPRGGGREEEMPSEVVAPAA